MTSTRVIIPTTEGLAEIQSLTEEVDDIESAMFVDGGLDESEVSESYRRFVSRQQGLIERETGHGSYRLDVSSPIDTGNSWQLAVYLAHRLLMRGELAGYDEPHDRIIVATGEVRLRGGEISVEPVQHIAQKVRQTARALDQKTGTPLLFVLPEENAKQIGEADSSLLPPGTEIVSVPPGAGGRQIVDRLAGSASVHSDRSPTVPVPAGDIAPRRGRKVLIAGAVAGLCLIVGTVALSGTDTVIGAKIASMLRDAVAAVGLPFGSPARPTAEAPAPSPTGGLSSAPQSPAPKEPAPPVQTVPRPTSIVSAVSFEITMAPPSLPRCSALRFQRDRTMVRNVTSDASLKASIKENGRLCRVKVVLELAGNNGAATFLAYRIEHTEQGVSRVLETGVSKDVARQSRYSLAFDMTRDGELADQVSILWVETGSGASAADVLKLFARSDRTAEDLRSELSKAKDAVVATAVLLTGGS